MPEAACTELIELCSYVAVCFMSKWAHYADLMLPTVDMFSGYYYPTMQQAESASG